MAIKQVTATHACRLTSVTGTLHVELIDLTFRNITRQQFAFFNDATENRTTAIDPQHKNLGFYGRRNREAYKIGCHYWLPTLFIAGLATLPWLPYRFSLRTLLVTITLVAFLLGAIVYAAK
jgi:hypothetical protein